MFLNQGSAAFGFALGGISWSNQSSSCSDFVLRTYSPMISSKFMPFHMTICQIMSDYGMLYIFFHWWQWWLVACFWTFYSHYDLGCVFRISVVYLFWFPKLIYQVRVVEWYRYSVDHTDNKENLTWIMCSKALGNSAVLLKNTIEIAGSCSNKKCFYFVWFE